MSRYYRERSVSAPALPPPARLTAENGLVGEKKKKKKRGFLKRMRDSIKSWFERAFDIGDFELDVDHLDMVCVFSCFHRFSVFAFVFACFSFLAFHFIHFEHLSFFAYAVADAFPSMSLPPPSLTTHRRT